VALHRKRRLLHWNRRQSSCETSSWISVQQRALPSCAGQGTPGRLTPTCPRPFPNVAASHAPVTRSLQLPRILSTISIQQLTMLLRFQCSKSTDNPKIYVSSAARQTPFTDIVHPPREPSWQMKFRMAASQIAGANSPSVRQSVLGRKGILSTAIASRTPATAHVGVGTQKCLYDLRWQCSRCRMES